MTLTSTNVDELTLVALGGSISATTAIAVVTMLRSGNDTAATYRAQRQFALPAIGAVAAVIVLLAIPASASNAATQGWRAPMLAGLAVLVVGIPAAVLLPPAVDVLRRDVRRRRSPAARAASRPAEWRDGGAISLSVCNVTKRYASGFLALHRVSFELTPGVIGLLGPNGAGKTTLLRIMTGLLTPTRGRVLYRGVAVGTSNLADYRRLIGFLPQEFNAYAGLTASDFLDFWALERGITGMRERHATVDRLLETVGLSQDATRRVRDFSGGMRQRIGIARALIGDPPLLIVDEPTTGLDLESRNRFRDLLGLLSTDRIVVLSTHIAGDVEATASRILLLVLGSLRFDGTAGALIERARGNVFEAVVGERDARALAARYRLTTRQRTAGGIRVRGVAPTATLLPGEAVEPTLEEAYLAAVGGERALNTSGFSFLFERRPPDVRKR
jgi:ABC-type multidrug transport system ATPase subunit